jgi:hypothetical protein
LTDEQTKPCLVGNFQELAFVLAPHASAQFFQGKTFITEQPTIPLDSQQSIADAARIHEPAPFLWSSRTIELPCPGILL